MADSDSKIKSHSDFALSHYTDAEVSDIRNQWRAVDRYLSLLERKPSSSLQELKLIRHRAWLECAFALYFHRYSDEQVCRYWSQKADEIIHQAAHAVGLDSALVGVFALGKLGAEELNLSSDIDLIFVQTDSVANSDVVLKAVRALIQWLGDVDEFGFCFRVDVSIRPGGRSGPLVSTVSGFENHYGYYGETWERLALIRLRGIVGSDALKTAVFDFVGRYVFRKRIDLGLLEELRLLIGRIRFEQNERMVGLKTQAASDLLAKELIHLKLAPGGIRELELIVHSLVVIHGGRNLNLRVRHTTEAIRQLSASRVISTQDAETLETTYWRLRAAENRLQCQNDEQTYWYSVQDSNRDEASDLKARMNAVEDFGLRILPGDQSDAIFNASSVEKLGLSPEIAQSLYTEIDSIELISRHPERVLKSRNLFLTLFCESLAPISAEHTELTMRHLIEFLKSSRTKVTFFELLNRNRDLIRILSLLFSTSPYATSLVLKRPELLDALLFGQSDSQSADLQTRLDQLFESRLVHEFIATTQLLSGGACENVTAELSSHADQITTELLQLAIRETQSEPIKIAALGKWGGTEVGLKSDLDFVLLTESQPTEQQHRASRRFLNWLRPIYAVDLRLRPTGSAGPLLVSRHDLLDYVEHQAMTWERQSWLRLRIVNADESDFQFRKKVLHAAVRPGLIQSHLDELKRIRTELFSPLNASSSEIDLKKSRGGLSEIEFAGQVLHLKLGSRSPVATELAASQSKTLSSQQKLNNSDFYRLLESQLDSLPGLTQSDLNTLSQTYEWLRTIEQLHRLTSELSDSKLNIMGISAEHLTRLVQGRAQGESVAIATRIHSPTDLQDEVNSVLECNALILEKVWNSL